MKHKGNWSICFIAFSLVTRYLDLEQQLTSCDSVVREIFYVPAQLQAGWERIPRELAVASCRRLFLLEAEPEIRFPRTILW